MLMTIMLAGLAVVKFYMFSLFFFFLMTSNRWAAVSSNNVQHKKTLCSLYRGRRYSWWFRRTKNVIVGEWKKKFILLNLFCYIFSFNHLFGIVMQLDNMIQFRAMQFLGQFSLWTTNHLSEQFLKSRSKGQPFYYRDIETRVRTGVNIE